MGCEADKAFPTRPIGVNLEDPHVRQAHLISRTRWAVIWFQAPPNEEVGHHNEYQTDGEDRVVFLQHSIDNGRDAQDTKGDGDSIAHR